MNGGRVGPASGLQERHRNSRNLVRWHGVRHLSALSYHPACLDGHVGVTLPHGAGPVGGTDRSLSTTGTTSGLHPGGSSAGSDKGDYVNSVIF
jgi:hypothetical protein